MPRRIERFETEFEVGSGEANLAWWPAWLLTQQSSLVVVHLAAAQPSRPEPPEQAMRLLVKILGLDWQGRRHGVVLQRKALRGP